jgi:hypothetical protein
VLGPKTASDSELSRGAIKPGLFLIFARWSATCNGDGDSSLLAIRQLGLTMHRAMLRYKNDVVNI